MRLYKILYDGEQYFVEAISFPQAIDVWKRHVKDAWGADYDGTEEPESVELLSEEPVLR